MKLLGETFSSLGNKNFRIYVPGLLASYIGYWIQTTVIGWLAYRLSGSSVVLGVMGFAIQMPLLVLGIFGGVLADRVDKRKALIYTQTLTAFQAVMLGVLTVTGIIQVWHIFVLALIWGIITAFTLPVRHAFTFELVGRKYLYNALALNSMLFHISRTIGPGLAGFLVHRFGEGLCFIINSLLIFALVYTLFKIKIKTEKLPEKKQSIFDALKSGVSYAAKNSFIKYPLILLLAVSTVVMPITVLMPVAVKKLLAGDARTLGFLMSSFGLGSFVGALMIAAQKSKKGFTLQIAFSGLIYGAGLIIFSLSKNFYLSCLALAAAGIGISRQTVGVNTILQLFVANNMRGRVMSLYMLTFVGAAPIGSMLFGKLADIFGISAVIFICGVVVISSALWFLSKVPIIRLSAYREVIKEEKLKGYKETEPYF